MPKLDFSAYEEIAGIPTKTIQATCADVSMGGGVTAGNTDAVYADEPLPERPSGRSTGYDFRGVQKDRVYTLQEAAELVGMTYQEAWNAYKKGSLRAVRSTWNGRNLFVTGAELKRVMREEFVPVEMGA